jgi:hypothetical protein
LTSQQLILAQMHALDDVTTVVEHTPDVLCVHRTSEMWVAVVFAISTCCTNTLQKVTNWFQLWTTYITMLPAAHNVQHWMTEMLTVTWKDKEGGGCGVSRGIWWD